MESATNNIPIRKHCSCRFLSFMFEVQAQIIYIEYFVFKTVPFNTVLIHQQNDRHQPVDNDIVKYGYVGK